MNRSNLGTLAFTTEAEGERNPESSLYFELRRVLLPVAHPLCVFCFKNFTSDQCS